MKHKILKNDKMIIELTDSFVMKNVSLYGENGEFPSYNSCNHQIGIWSEREGFEWLNSLQWQPHAHSGIDTQNQSGNSSSVKSQLSFQIEDFIHRNQKLYLRKLTLNHDSKYKQDYRLFFQQDFFNVNETVVYSLVEKSLYHENQGRYILFNGMVDNQGIVQCTTFSADEKKWIDTERGKLTFNPISSGYVKSIFSLETTLLPYEIKNIYYWMAIGNSLEEVNSINMIMKNKPEWLIEEYIGIKNHSFDRCYIGK